MAGEGAPAGLGAIEVGRAVGSVERGAGGAGDGGCGKGWEGFGGRVGNGGRALSGRGVGDCAVGIAGAGAGWKFDHWRERDRRGEVRD